MTTNDTRTCDLRMFGPTCPGFPPDVPIHETEPGPELHPDCLDRAQREVTGV